LETDSIFNLVRLWVNDRSELGSHWSGWAGPLYCNKQPLKEVEIMFISVIIQISKARCKKTGRVTRVFNYP